MQVLREIYQTQTTLCPIPMSEFQEVKELAEMSQLLDAYPDMSKLVLQDLVHNTDAEKGRKGMSAEQVLRFGILKQLRGYSYEEMPFQIDDSVSARWFVRIGIGDDIPSDTTIWENLTKMQPDTWQTILRLLADIGVELGVDDGGRVRGDCTVVESNIHYPTDSSLLFDFVRVTARTLSQGVRLASTS